jgi:hypothetical protein
MNILPYLDLKFSKNLATKQIIALGNLIGDALWMLEVEMIKKSGNKFYLKEINMLTPTVVKKVAE